MAGNREWALEEIKKLGGPSITRKQQEEFLDSMTDYIFSQLLVKAGVDEERWNKTGETVTIISVERREDHLT